MTAAITSTAELSRVVDQQRPRIENNSGQHFSDSDWERIRPVVVDDIVRRLPDCDEAVIDWDRSSVTLRPRLRSFEENAQTDWEIVRNNWELARDLDGQRRAIRQRSGLRFTDSEWDDEILPGLITSIIEHLPEGDQVHLDLGGVSVSRGGKRKRIEIQRSPDGSSSATITENP